MAVLAFVVAAQAPAQAEVTALVLPVADAELSLGGSVQ